MSLSKASLASYMGDIGQNRNVHRGNKLHPHSAAPRKVFMNDFYTLYTLYIELVLLVVSDFTLFQISGFRFPL
jgi:hypothetical protein